MKKMLLLLPLGALLLFGCEVTVEINDTRVAIQNTMSQEAFIDYPASTFDFDLADVTVAGASFDTVKAGETSSYATILQAGSATISIAAMVVTETVTSATQSTEGVVEITFTSPMTLSTTLIEYEDNIVVINYDDFTTTQQSTIWTAITAKRRLAGK